MGTLTDPNPPIPSTYHAGMLKGLSLSPWTAWLIMYTGVRRIEVNQPVPHTGPAILSVGRGQPIGIELAESAIQAERWGWAAGNLIIVQNHIAWMTTDTNRVEAALPLGAAIASSTILSCEPVPGSVERWDLRLRGVTELAAPFAVPDHPAGLWTPTVTQRARFHHAVRR